LSAALTLSKTGLRPNAGWRRLTWDANTFGECPAPESCTPAGCAEGHDPTNATELCSQCLPKYARFAQDQRCEPCPDGAMTSFIFFLAVLLAVALFSFLVWDNLDGAKDMIPEVAEKRRRKKTNSTIIESIKPATTSTPFSSKMPFHSIVIRIVSSYLQVAGMLQRFDLTLPAAVRTLIVVEASSSGLSEQLLLFDCGSDVRDVEHVFFLKQAMSLWVIPFVSVLAIAAVWACIAALSKRREARERARCNNNDDDDDDIQDATAAVAPLDGFVSSLMVLFYTLFPSVVSRVALTFSCRSFGDRHRGTSRLLLTEALSVQCLKGSHWTMMLTLGFPVVLLFIFFIPGFIAWTLIRQRRAGKLFAHQKHYDAKYTIRFGFMFAGYREGFEFWECVVMLRKCAFVLLSVFLRQYGASPQVVAASIVLFLATSAHLQFQPYADSKHNEVESIGLHACQLQLLITLLSNMIGRVDQLKAQSPIGPVSTFIVILFVFASTAQFFWVAILWTVRRSQRTQGAVGNIARCCGKKMPRLCKAVEVEEEEAQKAGGNNKKGKEGAAKTRSGAGNRGASGRSMARAMAGGIGRRSGTIKGSLRYNVKVAMHLERGIGAAEEYAATSAALQRKLGAQQARSRARLRSRILSRSSMVVVNSVGSRTTEPLPAISTQAPAPAAAAAAAAAMPAMTVAATEAASLEPPAPSVDEAAKARAFFKKLGCERTEELLAKLAVRVRERGRGSPEKLLAVLLQNKMQVQDVATAMAEMRTCSGGEGAKITAEGLQRWARGGSSYIQ
jgi:hypothetical protein